MLSAGGLWTLSGFSLEGVDSMLVGVNSTLNEFSQPDYSVKGRDIRGEQSSFLVRVLNF